MSSKANGDFETKYGKIHARYPGPFEPYGNFQVHKQTTVRYVKLQGPAIRAFKAAEARCATKKHPYILITGHGYRSYADQKALWETDHQRYADPDESNHVEGLAVDVQWDVSILRKRAVTRALKAEGFIFGVDGEPWHASYFIAG